MKSIYHLLLLCFIFAGCQPGSSILFIYKDFSYEVLELNPQMEDDLKRSCIENSYVPEFAIITREGEKSIRNIIEETRSSIIYIDPLIRESPGDISADYSDKLFFTLKRNLAGEKNDNLLILHFDRMEIFKEAGVIAGKLLINLIN